MPIIINQNTPTGKKVIILDNRNKLGALHKKESTAKPSFSNSENKSKAKSNSKKKGKSNKNVRKSSRPMREMIFPIRQDGINIEDAYNYIWDYSDIIVDYIKNATAGAPIPVDIKISGDTREITSTIKFMEEKTEKIDYSNVYDNNNEFSVEKLKSAVLAKVYTECSRQMSLPSFDEFIIEKEKETFIKQVENEINTEYEINDRSGYHIKDGQIFVTSSKTDHSLKKNFEPEFTGVMEGTGINKHITYPDSLKNRIAKQIKALRDECDDISVNVSGKIPNVEAYNEKKKEYLDKYGDALFFSSKYLKKAFNNERLTFKAGHPDTLELITKIGTFSTSTEWAFVDFKEKLTDEWDVITSDEIQNKIKIWNELIEPMGYKVEFNGGQGILMGVTRIVIKHPKLEKGIILDNMNFIDGDFETNVKNMIADVEEKATELRKAAEEKFRERAKRSATSTLTQLMFLKLWKEVEMPWSDYIHYAKTEGHMENQLAYDITGILRGTQAIKKEEKGEKRVILGRFADIMYEMVNDAINISDIDETLSTLSQIAYDEAKAAEEARKEREANASKEDSNVEESDENK